MSKERKTGERAVSYERQTVQSPNPIARFVHRKRIARSISLVDQYVSPGGTYVDFGAGTGLLLHALKPRRPDARLFGIEPYMPCAYPESAHYLASLKDLQAGSVDVISAFEVCEHLYEEELMRLAAECKSALKPSGKLIVSVPIMYGIAVVPKVLNKVVLYGQNNTGYGLKELVKSLAGIPIPRPDNPRHTHLGFDFRQLIRTLSETYTIEQVYQHPFGYLPWFVNSQVFLVCADREHAGSRR